MNDYNDYNYTFCPFVGFICAKCGVSYTSNPNVSLCMKCISSHCNSAKHKRNNTFRDDFDGMMCKYLLLKFARDIFLNSITREDINWIILGLFVHSKNKTYSNFTLIPSLPICIDGIQKHYYQYNTETLLSVQYRNTIISTISYP